MAKNTMFKIICFLFQIMEFLSMASALSHTERRLADEPGFISIDCGLAAGSYYYPPNGLYYTSDEKYITTGTNFGVSSSFYSSGHEDLYPTLRSFPEGRRNCYTLSPVTPNTTYLIRTRFMYGNYDSKDSIPGFDVYIGVNLWFTVALNNAGYRMYSEIIHIATSESINVCLVNTGQGTPFISALELRKLDYSSYPASPEFSLETWVHDDAGTSSNSGSSYEVFGDAYDRLWRGDSCGSLNWRGISSNGTIDTSQAIQYEVPAHVLSTACESSKSSVTLTTPMNKDLRAQVYIYWHFAELELLGSNDTREFNINVLGYTELGPITPKYLQVTTIAFPKIPLNGSGVLTITLEKTAASNRYPIVNGMEFYTVLNLFASPTDQADVDAVVAIRDTYAVNQIWQGDPCLPINYQWEGLNCTHDNNNPPTITSLNLSSSLLIGELPPSLANLTSLTYLNLSNNEFTGHIPKSLAYLPALNIQNLSNNGFTGHIPKFLAYLPALNIIDLSGNNLTGPVPQELIQKASKKSIVLRLEGNVDICKSYPCMDKLALEVKKKRHHFIFPVIACVASIVLLVILVTILLRIFKPRIKQVKGTIKSRTTQFNFSEIRKMTSNFRKVIGKGGFGTVYYGELRDGTQVAVKLLNNVSSTITLKQFCAEAELLTRIHHVNLVSLIGYCDDHANMALVYELVSRGNLQMHLSESNKNPFCWKTRLQIAIDAAHGLDYLHSHCKPHIIHRDIKPANILLDEKERAKIADFGLSRLFTTNSQGGVVSTDYAGTVGYLDPEYVNTLSKKSDVYAFGVVLLQLLTGQPALIKNNNVENGAIQIARWVSEMVESGDILAIVDKKLHGDLSVESAWRFWEIAMKCVEQIGDQRPEMSVVVADLKLCYASEEFNNINRSFHVENGNYYPNSNQGFDTSIMSLPSAR